MKYRISLIALSALLAFSACKAEPERHYVKNDKDQEEEVIPEGNGKTLLAGSFNIRYFNTTDTYPWSVRKDAVFKFIETTSPDFLGLQEVKATQSQDFAYKLSGTYGYYDIDRDTGKGISSGSGEGIGILYKKGRFELKDKGFFWLADTPDKLPEKNEDGTYSSWNSAKRRVVVWTKVADKLHDNQIVWFFATHFDHISVQARTKSSELTISKIKELTGIADLSKSSVPIFLVADFNCTLNSTELAPVRAAMGDARTLAKKTESGRTFNGFGETKQSVIDHIFFVGNVNADRYHIATEDYGVKYISDHYPITLLCSYK